MVTYIHKLWCLISWWIVHQCMLGVIYVPICLFVYVLFSCVFKYVNVEVAICSCPIWGGVPQLWYYWNLTSIMGYTRAWTESDYDIRTTLLELCFVLCYVVWYDADLHLCKQLVDPIYFKQGSITVTFDQMLMNVGKRMLLLIIQIHFTVNMLQAFHPKSLIFYQGEILETFYLPIQWHLLTQHHTHDLCLSTYIKHQKKLSICSFPLFLAYIHHLAVKETVHMIES